MNLLPKISPQPAGDRHFKAQRALMRKEAEIGGRLFGPLPKGRQRQFFCLDEHTWIWHEEWQDARGKRRAVTTRYDVRPNGVIKIQDNHVYQRLTLEEARNLYKSAKLYHQKVGAYYQNLLQTA